MASEEALVVLEALRSAHREAQEAYAALGDGCDDLQAVARYGRASERQAAAGRLLVELTQADRR